MLIEASAISLGQDLQPVIISQRNSTFMAWQGGHELTFLWNFMRSLIEEKISQKQRLGIALPIKA